MKIIDKWYIRNYSLIHIDVKARSAVVLKYQVKKNLKNNSKNFDDFLKRILNAVNPNLYILDFSKKKEYLLPINCIHYYLNKEKRVKILFKTPLKILIKKENKSYHVMAYQNEHIEATVNPSLKIALRMFQNNIYTSHKHLLKDSDLQEFNEYNCNSNQNSI